MRPYSVQHTRCGTSLLYILVISIFLFAPLTFRGLESEWLALLLRFATRIALVPVVAAIAYKINPLQRQPPESAFMRALIWPGLQLQKLTTTRADPPCSKPPSPRSNRCSPPMALCCHRAAGGGGRACAGDCVTATVSGKW